MKHKDVIEVYNNIISQIQNKIGKKVKISYPNRKGIPVTTDYEVTINRINALIDRRNKLMGVQCMEIADIVGIIIKTYVAIAVIVIILNI